MTLTRAKLEQLVGDLIDETRDPVIKALADAGLQPRAINEIVLVGGQIRMPTVQTLVKRIFEKDPNKSVNSDEVVAIGAAIQAGVLTGDVRDVLLLDVTPLSLGIETLGGVSTRLIDRNTTIPTQKSQVFSTDFDNQTSFEVHVLQGEREMARDNRSLGRFILDGIPPAPRGQPEIEVTFDIDAIGIVSVKAHVKGTGREQHITIQPSSGLSKDEIDHLVRDAQSYSAADSIRSEAVDLRNQADSEAYNAEKTLRELGDKITSDQRVDVESKIADVRAALGTEDLGRIKETREAMQHAFYRISEEIYASMQTSNAQRATPRSERETSAPAASLGSSEQQAGTPPSGVVW